MLDGGEVGGRVIGANAAFIVKETHIEDPVSAILDHPVGSDRRPDLDGIAEQLGFYRNPSRTPKQAPATPKVILVTSSLARNGTVAWGAELTTGMARRGVPVSLPPLMGWTSGVLHGRSDQGPPDRSGPLGVDLVSRR
jgi:hypothetical protein